MRGGNSMCLLEQQGFQLFQSPKRFSLLGGGWRQAHLRRNQGINLGIRSANYPNVGDRTHARRPKENHS
jgi:hypothetical protein